MVVAFWWKLFGGRLFGGCFLMEGFLVGAFWCGNFIEGCFSGGQIGLCFVRVVSWSCGLAQLRKPEKAWECLRMPVFFSGLWDFGILRAMPALFCSFAVLWSCGLIGALPRCSQSFSVVPRRSQAFSGVLSRSQSCGAFSGSRCPPYHAKQKKATEKTSVAVVSFAEGTGFEPADTLRYRQFSKLLV